MPDQLTKPFCDTRDKAVGDNRADKECLFCQIPLEQVDSKNENELYQCPECEWEYSVVEFRY